jgi:hypothetical protein
MSESFDCADGARDFPLTETIGTARHAFPLDGGLVKIIFTLEVPTIIFNVCILFVKVCAGAPAWFECVAVGTRECSASGARRAGARARR